MFTVKSCGISFVEDKWLNQDTCRVSFILCNVQSEVLGVIECNDREKWKVLYSFAKCNRKITAFSISLLISLNETSGTGDMYSASLNRIWLITFCKSGLSLTGVASVTDSVVFLSGLLCCSNLRCNFSGLRSFMDDSSCNDLVTYYDDSISSSLKICSFIVLQLHWSTSAIPFALSNEKWLC